MPLLLARRRQKILKILSVSGCSEAIWPPLAHFGRASGQNFFGGGAKHTLALLLRFLGGGHGPLAPRFRFVAVHDWRKGSAQPRNRNRAFHKRVIPYHENYHVKCDEFKAIFCNCIIFRGPELESHLEPHYITINFAGFWFP